MMANMMANMTLRCKAVFGQITSRVHLLDSWKMEMAQAPPGLFLAPPESFEPPLTIEQIMH